MLFLELVKQLDGKTKTLEDRIILHKKIYFLQEVFKALISTKDRYQFFMYKHGPYSSALASDVLQSTDFEIVVDEAKLKEFVEFSPKLEEDVKKWETAASIHFFQSRGREKEEIFSEISKKSYLADRTLFESVWVLIDILDMEDV